MTTMTALTTMKMGYDDYVSDSDVYHEDGNYDDDDEEDDDYSIFDVDYDRNDYDDDNDDVYEP